MDPLIIGIFIGIALGCVALWFVDKTNKERLAKLHESRSKLERQRTQAVNDLFALRSEIDSGNVSAAPAQAGPDPKVAAEIANLKNLVVRADAALSVARRKRNDYEEEINRLRTQLGQTDAKVINLREERPAIGS